MSLGRRNQRDRALILEALSATLRDFYFTADALRTDEDFYSGEWPE